MSGVFLRGNLVQVLRNALKLSSFSTLSSGTTNPSVVALDGVQGDVYFSTAGVYYKNDAGVTTNWTKFASGGTLPSFTLNSIPFSDAFGVLTEDNADFTFDPVTKTLTVKNLTVNGTATTIATTNTDVTDKLITLNSGGAVTSGSGVGFQVEENAVDTGYVKTSADRLSWDMLAPASAGIVTVTPGAGGFTLNQGSHNPVTIGTANGLSLSTQALSLGLSSAVTTGALAAADFTTFNAKEPAITATTSADYYRGDKTFHTLDTLAVPENTNLYFTTARARAAVSATAPIVDVAGVFSIPPATAIADGYLTSSDFTHFNSTYVSSITNTYIVDAINGDDATGNGSYNRPYKTIQAVATLIGSAASNAEFNDATKSYYCVKVFGSTTEANVTFGTRPNIVLDMSNGVLVGNLVIQFNQGAIFGANNQQPHFTVLGADLRAGYGGLFGYSGINGNLFYESVGSGSALIAQLHMINTGVTGDIHQRLGTGGGVFTLSEFLTGTMVTGKIICDTAPSTGSTTLYANNSDTSGSRAIGGATGSVQIYQLHNVRFDGAVVVQSAQGGRWFDVQFGAFAHDFTGSSGTTSMDANTYESWQTNVASQGTVVAALLDTSRGVKYTPTTSGNWSPTPTTVLGGLDQLASRVPVAGAVSTVTASAPIASSGGLTPNISLTGVVAVANGGTNSSAALNNNRVMTSSGGAIVESAAITANRALVSDASGIPIASTVTDTTLAFLDATSSVQTQLNGKQATISTSAAVANQFITAFTAPNTFSRAQPDFTNLTGTATAAQMLALPSNDLYIGNGSNQPVATAVSGDLSNVAGAFTVNTVGASSAANIHSAELAANAATATPTASTIAKWDASSNLSANALNTSTFVDFTEIVTPANPAASHLRLYSKAGDGIYVLNSSGTETQISTGGGSVSSVSVVSANGLAGSVATATTTPAITLSTTISGVLKGNGTAISAASAGTDYQAPITTSSAPANQFFNSWTAPNTFGSAQPSFSNLSGNISAAQMLALPTADIYVGDGSNQPAAVAMSGDTAIASSGAVTIQPNVVSNSKLSTAPASTIKGNNTGSTGNVLDLTVTQAQSLLGISPSQPIATNKLVYVSQYGSDITGDGTYDKPFATTAAAYTAITTAGGATTTNRYSIHITGTVTEVNIYLKPFCWFYGNAWGDARLNATSGNITLDPTAYTAGNSRSGMTNIYLTGSTGINLDFVSVSATGSHVVEMQDIGVNGAVVLTGNNTNQYFQWRGALTFSDFTIHGTAGLLTDMFIAGNLVLDNGTVPTADPGANFIASFIGGNLSVTGNGATQNLVQLTGCTISGTTTVSGAGATLVTDAISIGPASTVTVSGGGTLTRSSDAYALAYVPSVPGNWSPAPTYTASALDQLAASKQPTGNYVTAGTGDATFSGPGSAAVTLATVNASPGTYNYATLTVNAKGLVTSASSGSAPTGTVTSVSVVTANGLAGTVATATTTPAITLSTTVTGVLKGNGTAISAASAGTDYQAPISNATAPANQFFNSWTAPNTFGSAQPAFSDLSGNITAAQMLALPSADFYVGNGSNQPAAVAMSGDASLANTGAVTVNTVGASSAANIHSAELAANAATATNTASTIVKRDGSGNFAAGTITAALTGTASGNLVKITGDIDPSSFSLSNNVSSAADITGLAFANGTVRGAHIVYSITVSATASLYEFGSIYAIQKGASWEISQFGTGDATLVDITITSAGQLQYTTPSYAGFTSAVMKFRAVTTPV